MTSSPRSAESYNSQQEFDTPFLGETVFEADTQAERVSYQINSDVVSPFLDELALEQKTFTEPASEVSEVSEVSETSEAELEEESTTAFEETSLEPEIHWERSDAYACNHGDAIEPELVETLEEGEIDERAWRMRPPVRYQADRSELADRENQNDPFTFSSSEYEDSEEGSKEVYAAEYDPDAEPTESEFIDELEYQNFVQKSGDLPQEGAAIYEDESSRGSRLRKEKSSYTRKIDTRISDNPKPGSFYRIRRGDNLLKIAGRAYAVQPGKKRLAFAQFINRSSLNQKYWVQGKSKFVKTYFSHGIISFYPRFSCNLKEMLEPKKTPMGKCYAVIWIPPLKSYRQPFIKDEIRFELESAVEPTRVDQQPVDQPSINQQEVRSPKDNFFSEVQDHLYSKAPFGWICMVGSYFPDPDLSGNLLPGFGTGILISPRHVLTAAHVLFADYLGSGKKPTPARNMAAKVVVAAGLHGKGRNNRKFLGKYDSKVQKNMKILVPDEWKASEDNRNYDFALIDLGEDVSDVTRGYWGGNQNYKITAINPVTSRKRAIVSVGYPGIKIKQDIYSQWKSLGETDNSRTKKYQKRFKNLIAHDALVYKGMSGGPIWTETKTSRSFVRNLVAINSFGQEETVEVNMKDYVKDPSSTSLTVNFTAEHDVGVAMTRNVLDRLNAWGLSV